MISLNMIVLGFWIILALIIGYFIGKRITQHNLDQQLPEIRADAIAKSRAVLGGQFSEQLAPFLPQFPYLPTEVRFIGKPIDFIVFKGMDDAHIDEVVFVEVKSGKARISPVEKSLKEAIENKNIRWVEYRVPGELTSSKSQ